MNQLTEPVENDSPIDRPVVVGVGASAGGLEAIVQLLIQSPVDVEISYVIIQHLSPDHDSALAEILGKRVKLPIHQVTESTKVLPNHVYVIPPGKYLSIKDCELTLSEPPDARNARMAVDYFFRSLAEDAWEHGIGVILSGTGSDGSAGLKEIKDHGGLTVVQDPDEASHRGMPQAAVKAGAVDLILPVSEIAPRLVRYVHHAREHGPLSAQAIASMEQADHTAVMDVLRQVTKHDFRNYRNATLARRISRRMGLAGLDQIHDYVALLHDNRDELEQLRNDLLIGVTRFFRDARSWKMLQEKVIKDLVMKADERTPLRFWSAGCASGEEPYTLAMVVLEQMKLSDKHVPFQIFASDVSAESLDFAREGVYPDSIAADVPVEQLREYFQKVDGGYRVSKQLREHVVFAEQNVLVQAPFSKLDCITCRNLLIYLKRQAQENIFSVFQFALKTGGHLFLGSSESVERSADLFDTINAKHRIYRRTNAKVFPPTRANEAESPSIVKSDQPSSPPPPTGRLGHLAYRQLMQEFEQGVAIIDEQFRVLYVEGRADLYLQLHTGEMSAELPDLFAIARDGVKSRLRTMIRKTRQANDPVEETCRVQRDGSVFPCRIRMRKLSAVTGPDRPILITFQPLSVETTPVPERLLSGDEAPVDQEELRHELLTTREQLSTTIAQLETANEELKASNEEAMSMNEQLQSGNEELETSKEELQSLNEELTTLNNQLELKLEELQHTTDDLNNLLTSASVPTIFLDTNLRLRRFTPSCDVLYNFIGTDVGRPLSDIVQKHDDDSLIDDAKRVLQDLVPLDKELICSNGQCFIRRILPYRTEDDRIQGVVVTFADVTELSGAKKELSQNLAVMDNIYQSAPVGLGFLTQDLKFVRINDELAEIDGVSADDHIGRHLRDILPPDLAGDVVKLYQKIIDTGEPLLNVEIKGRTKASESERTWQASYMPVKGDDGNVIGINVVVQDVTDRQRNAKDLAESRDRLEIALTGGRMGTWHYHIESGQVDWSSQMYDLFGVNREEFVPRRDSFLKRVHPDDREYANEAIDGPLQNGGETHRLECRIVRDNDREVVWIESRGLIRRDEDGKPISMTGVTIDVTERHRHEERLQLAKDSAEAANRSRGEFLANMSHEIRTPMTAIIGYADMLSSHLRDPDNLQCVETIRRNGRFLLEIIDDILDLSKIDAGKFEVERERIAPERIIADIVSLMNVRAEEKKLKLEVEFESELPKLIETDGKRLRQILLNLVGNAIKFTEDGKVRLVARYDHDQNQLALSVEDTGIGIDSESLDNLFEPFTQADGSITRTFGGTGLGLAISHRLAEVLGGKIEVESKPGQGSMFTLAIDPGEIDGVEFAMPSTVQVVSNADEEDVQLDGYYLIVDDRRDIRYLAQHFIESAGGTISTAGDGQAGVDAIQTAIDEGRPFTAVCMDMQMPILDGYGAVREIRRRGIDVPIIALTANAMQGDQDDCMEAGCTAFISKPIDKKALLSKLKEVSGKKHGEVG
ncbi:Aerobic respiration control sensor protein ArcB [Rubripirellula obstinata]|uniref:histidine kinase n=1 Tax=Rubripirellula obstinata TaxID=406547 RepID=A0A5B1CP90_9BACT|nr:CheR family methyltransferase [Rubripirellula obstinata]KAA1261183.1 Aerobic respiration control sensor protein ArcB [Rubripirellula obstinata]